METSEIREDKQATHFASRDDRPLPSRRSSTWSIGGGQEPNLLELVMPNAFAPGSLFRESDVGFQARSSTQVNVDPVERVMHNAFAPVKRSSIFCRKARQSPNSLEFHAPSTTYAY